MNDFITLTGAPSYLRGSIQIPGSKSESNRALILKALSKDLLEIHNLSSADDSLIMVNLLSKVAGNQFIEDELLLDTGPAGTVMRFLIAYLSIRKGSFILTGSERMLQRPIKILVEALILLGANIEYLGELGFPPLKIKGKNWLGKSIKVPGNISSQYLSALLLIAPFTPNGLEIELKEELTSAPYVEMTIQMMNLCGLRVQKTWVGWKIEPQTIRNSEISIEPDWSSASYLYALAAFSDKVHLELNGFKQNSLQGDRKIALIMENFGIHTQFTDKGIVITKDDFISYPKSLNLKECPDIAQTLMVIAAGLGIDLEFSGLETLKIKETDRVEAIKKELAKLNVPVISDEGQTKVWGTKVNFPNKIEFNTYHDHRMALSLVPLIYHIPEVTIQNRSVVNKSYPTFWADLESLGFKIK